jgi:hypothetical protein
VEHEVRVHEGPVGRADDRQVPPSGKRVASVLASSPVVVFTQPLSFRAFQE